MTAPPEVSLAGLFAERAAWVGREPVKPAEVRPDDCTVPVVLRDLNLTDFVAGAGRFAAGLSSGEADAWRRSWTSARFLFGNPLNLPGRTPARVVGDAGDVAWLAPCSPVRLPGLCRLLKPVTGRLPTLPPVVTVAGTGPARTLYVATGGLSLAEYLVHLHHTVAEAVLRKRLGGSEAVELRHRPQLESAKLPGVPGYARVHHSRVDASRLRLYTWLAASGDRQSEPLESP